MKTDWEGHIRGKTLAEVNAALTADYLGGQTALSETANATTAIQVAAALACVAELIVALGVIGTNLEVAASGFDNGQAGPHHEAGITVTVRKTQV